MGKKMEGLAIVGKQSDALCLPGELAAFQDCVIQTQRFDLSGPPRVQLYMGIKCGSAG